MADDVPLRKAKDTALLVYRATRDGVDVADSRSYLLERHLHGKREAGGRDVEELASFGLAHLALLPEDEC
jgi:hypothetical protein